MTDTPADAQADVPELYPTRTEIMLRGLRSTAFVSLQVVACALGLWVLFWVLGQAWVVLLPVLFAVVLCTVLWPPVRWMRASSRTPGRRSRGDDAGRSRRDRRNPRDHRPVDHRPGSRPCRQSHRRHQQGVRLAARPAAEH